jgi:hypothetical protein
MVERVKERVEGRGRVIGRVEERVEGRGRVNGIVKGRREWRGEGERATKESGTTETVQHEVKCSSVSPTIVTTTLSSFMQVSTP